VSRRSTGRESLWEWSSLIVQANCTCGDVGLAVTAVTRLRALESRKLLSRVDSGRNQPISRLKIGATHPAA